MNMADGQHPREALQDLMDNRLVGQAHAEVVAHIASCSYCASELEILRWTRSTSATAFASATVPESLEMRIQEALSRAERPSRRNRGPWLTPVRRPALALAVLILMVLTVGIALLSKRGDLPTRVARDYTAYRADAINLELRTANVVELERFFEQKGLAFQARVLDLGMMEQRLVGGRVHRIHSRQGVLFVYAGPAGQVLVCQMYEGSLSDLPAPEQVRGHDGIEFRVYERSGTTVVFWQEGAIVCVLAGDGATQDVLDLAFAKAMKV